MSGSRDADFREVPHEQLAAANSLCDRFEAAWRSGARPALSSFINAGDGLSSDSILRLLVPLDIDYRRLAGESPAVGDYQAQFPGANFEWLTPFLTPDAGPAAPSTIGGYRIDKRLGAGGMGTVYKGWHERMRRHVAIKVVHESLAGQVDLVQRFAREVVAAARLSHPNIVRAYDAGEHEGKLYLVTEYIEGVDLGVRVKRQGPLGVGTAVEFVIQAARGLEYAHAHGVTHRDIKPSNLLLDEQGTIRILDLGLARFEEEAAGRPPVDEMLTTSRAILGTVDYMAPEQALDPRVADASCDIYSLGCTLYYLLTARPCYRGATLFERLVAHREQPIPSLAEAAPAVPAQLDDIFRRMIAKRPQDRYPRMSDVIADLTAVAVDLPADDAWPANRQRGVWSPYTPHDSSQPARTIGNLSATLVERERKVAGHGRRSKLLWAAAAIVPLAALAYSATRQRDDRVEPLERPPERPPLAVAPFSADEARAHQRRWAEYCKAPVRIEHPSEVRLVLIPPGRFTMGTDAGQVRALSKLRMTAQEAELLKSESPPHEVEITRPFYLGVTEVTVGQFRRFAKAADYLSEAERPGGKAWGWEGGAWKIARGYNWQDRGETPITDAHPAVNLTWNDAVAYCRWLTDTSGGDAAYRLPTEAEWEFACRAGTLEPWHSGTEMALRDYAWLVFNSNQRPQPVGRKRPNALGLYDMHGNTKEWCADRYQSDYYSVSPSRDPTGPLTGDTRVVRGGRAPNAPHMARSASRHHAPPASTFEGGFRVARDLE